MAWLDLNPSLTPPAGVSCTKTFDSLTIAVPHDRWLLALYPLAGVCFLIAVGISLLSAPMPSAVFPLCLLGIVLVLMVFQVFYSALGETRIVVTVQGPRWELVIYSGVQGLGWVQRVEMSEVLEFGETFFMGGNWANTTSRMEIRTAERSAVRSIRFGAFLKPPQREFVLGVLREMQRQCFEYRGAKNPPNEAGGLGGPS